MALNPDTGKEYTYEEFKHKFNGISGDAWNQSRERVEYDLDRARKDAAEAAAAAAAAQQQAAEARRQMLQQQGAQQAAYEKQLAEQRAREAEAAR